MGSWEGSFGDLILDRPSGFCSPGKFAKFEAVIDYARRASLTIPWMENLPGGKQEPAWLNEIAALLPTLVARRGGTLVLSPPAGRCRRYLHACPPVCGRGR